MAKPDNEREAKWDKRFMGLAAHVSDWSSDPATKVGGVIVGPDYDIRSIGYNGLPRGIEARPERLRRPQKYAWLEHAERNAIFNAARNGVPLLGCRMYINWFPCVDCARAIHQAGLFELVGIEPDWSDSTWGVQFVQAEEILKAGGVRIRFLKMGLTCVRQ